MSSVEVYVVVEGRTEQTFIRDVLAPAMSYQGVFLYPALIGKPGHKGGDVRFDRAKTDIGNFLQQRHDTYVSTMFDYFRNAGKRFIPYVEMHEFEAMLFSDASILAKEADIDISAIDRILDEHGEPEEVDDDPLQAPSKQIIALNSSYRKVAMGKVITEAIGIPILRKKCSHFDEWLTKLERLAIGRDTEQEKSR